METILARHTISISELKKNPAAAIDAADGEPVAVLVHNRPSAYPVPAETYRSCSSVSRTPSSPSSPLSSGAGGPSTPSR